MIRFQINRHGNPYQFGTQYIVARECRVKAKNAASPLGSPCYGGEP